MMETLPVTLIVKAPNQQIEDQTIRCQASWTVDELKRHLSEVYPSKPARHEQKLIYSGQLLSDSATLKDVLRRYDGQETHTLHLVCATKAAPHAPQPYSPPATAEVPAAAPDTHPTWTNATEYDPRQYAMHLAWMQQAYMQYMAQYMQLAANPYGTAAPTAEPQTPPERQPAAAAAQPPAAPAPQRDPDNPERDWLDVFYMFSRVIVLFSVIYFYSSPIRFLFVIFLGFVLYLYQIGFFRNANVAPAAPNNNNNTPVGGGGADETPPAPDQTPSRLTVVWTFFATFFASLIPEIPNAV